MNTNMYFCKHVDKIGFLTFDGIVAFSDGQKSYFR